MSSPLLIVELVLKEGAALDHLGRLVADYLGPDRNLPLSAACNLGSTTLLDWMWERSPVSAAHRTSHWSLTNNLRSDPHYYQYQFRESMAAATKKGDLRVIQWLMEHFSGCQVPVSVVEIAARRGRPDILQFLLEHDAARGKEEEENKSGAPCRKKRRVDAGKVENREQGQGNVVQWGGRSLLKAAQMKRFDVVRFLYENRSHDGVNVHAATMEATMECVVAAGEMELAEVLLPRGKSVLDYGRLSSNPVVLQRRLAAGLMGNKLEAAGALKRLVPSGRLDLMQEIWAKHELVTSTGGWMEEWVEAMSTACLRGDLAILRWMVGHASGRAAIAYLKQKKVTPLLYHATSGGHVDVMHYLYAERVAADFGGSLLCAIRENNMDAVKWLVDHFSPLEKVPEYCILVEAARYRQVGMLQYFHSSVSLPAPGFPGSRRFSILGVGIGVSSKIASAAKNSSSCMHGGVHTADYSYNASHWLPTDAMDDAAANGQLEAVKWLHLNRAEGCTAKVMDEAAANGQLEVMKWLHANRSEGYTYKAIYYAAAGYNRTEVVKWLVSRSRSKLDDFAMQHAIAHGNLALVQWLHTETSARCAAKEMVCAAEHGQLEILKYLYSHRAKGSGLKSCATAVERSIANGHFRAAHWCLEHFPGRCPNVGKVSYLYPFESLLLLRENYPELFTTDWVATIRASLRSRDSKTFSFVVKWLDSQISEV